jgi:hypothetical protein
MDRTVVGVVRLGSMSVLIQDFASGNYLRPDGRWTTQFSKAIKFEQVLRAWEAIDEQRLSGVRIVFEPGASSKNKG